MRLTRLELGHLPGITPHPRWVIDDFDAESTVIVGPNASGKSSLVRALHALLNPDGLRDAMVDVAAEFVEGDVTWRVKRLGASVEWTRNGVPSEAPVTPTDVHLQGVTLRIEDLLAAQTADESIAQRIARELSGGFDLEGVRHRAPFTVGPRHGRTEATRVQEAERALTAERQQATHLQDQEAQRDAWTVELKEAQRIVDRAESLRAAQRLLDAQARLHELDAVRETLPAGMEHLTDGAIEDHARHRERRDDLDKRERTAEVARTAAQDALNDSGLADHDVEIDALDVMAAMVDELDEQEAILQRSEVAIEAAQGEMAEAVTALGGEPDGVPNLTPAALQRVEDLLDAARNAQAQRDAAYARLEMLEANLGNVGLAPDAPVSDVERNADRLRAVRSEAQRLLRARGSAPLASWPGWLLLLAGVGALAIASVQGAWFAAGLAATLFIAGVTWTWLTRRSGGTSPDPRAAREAVHAAEIEPPTAWDVGSLRTWLDGVDDQLAQATAAHRDALERDQRRRDLSELEATLGDVDAQRDALAHDLGVAPDTFDLSYARWLQRAHAWDEARRRHEEALAERSVAERILRERQVRIEEALVPLETNRGDVPAGEDAEAGTAAQWRARLDAVRKRLEARNAARQALRDAEREKERITRERSELAKDEASWLDRLHLDDSEDVEVAFQRRLEARERWQVWSDERALAQADERSARASLEGAPELLALADAGDRTTIETELQQVEAAQATVQGRTEDIARVNAEVESATKGQAFASAAARVREARSVLRDAREQATFAAAAQVLFDDVAEAFEATTRPAMLEDAERTFATFTRHAYALQFERSSEGPPRFVAKEARSGLVRSFKELSTGTRMQAFLAVRMAFARAMEADGPALPVVLDEALTASDPERFEAVVTSLARVAREDGRQLLYLSARREDAVAWRNAMNLNDAARVGCTVLEITHEQLVEQPSLAEVAVSAPERIDVPPPEGASPEEYAVEVGVTAIDPWSDPTTIHVFHLLRDDLPLLGVLLSVGVVRVGVLETWLPSEGVQALVDTDSTELLERRMVATRAWVEAWREGRGRPIDAHVLEASEAVSESFLAELTAIAAEAGGDARALLEAIDAKRVKGFRSAKRDELADYLEAEGHLVDGEALTASERVARMASVLEQRGFTPDATELAQLDADLEAGIVPPAS